jgi:hypothetical protein
MNALLAFVSRRSPARRTRSVDPGAAALWASAFVVMAMILTQAGSLTGGGGAAYADVSETGDLTVLTAASAVDEDILCVLDKRAEKLVIYGVENRNRLVRLNEYDLREMFVSARQFAGP